VTQPIGEFFIGVIPSKALIEISYADVRTIENDLDQYLGIQRKLSPSRVKDLKDYVHSIDATFPTSIVLAVDMECADWDESNKVLTLRETESTEYEKIAKILDGQHRIEGLKEYEKDDFDLNVTIFVDADIADQANIFATVNLAQTKVNKSLVYDLYDYSRSRSPQKTAHDVVVAIDRIKGSPFYQMIKRLGFATPGRSDETLTQAAIVETLLKNFISSTPREDRNTLIRGKALRAVDNKELEKLPFRNLFINEDDRAITQNVLEFFSAVEEKWPNAWKNKKEKGNILPKPKGDRALFRFLRVAYVDLASTRIGRIVEKEEYLRILSQINLTDDDFRTELFPPGTSGESELYKRLMQESGYM
jgi:DGQHR domain-containing protein